MSSKTWYICPTADLTSGIRELCESRPHHPRIYFSQKFLFLVLSSLCVDGFVLGALMIKLGIFSMLHKCATTELPPAQQFLFLSLAGTKPSSAYLLTYLFQLHSFIIEFCRFGRCSICLRWFCSSFSDIWLKFLSHIYVCVSIYLCVGICMYCVLCKCVVWVCVYRDVWEGMCVGMCRWESNLLGWVLRIKPRLTGLVACHLGGQVISVITC